MKVILLYGLIHYNEKIIYVPYSCYQNLYVKDFIMKLINNVLLASILFLGVNVFADEIYFISPKPGHQTAGSLTIQIEPPYHKTDVDVWIKNEDGIERVVWRGKLTAATQYAITVDTSKFKPGRYEVKAEYYVGREDYDGDVDIWIGTGNLGEGGEYFPQ